LITEFLVSLRHGFDNFISCSAFVLKQDGKLIECRFPSLDNTVRCYLQLFIQPIEIINNYYLWKRNNLIMMKCILRFVNVSSCGVFSPLGRQKLTPHTSPPKCSSSSRNPEKIGSSWSCSNCSSSSRNPKKIGSSWSCSNCSSSSRNPEKLSVRGHVRNVLRHLEIVDSWSCSKCSSSSRNCQFVVMFEMFFVI
jgi:hypothetical protein